MLFLTVRPAPQVNSEILGKIKFQEGTVLGTPIKIVTSLKERFTKLQCALGDMNGEDVLERFLNQRVTKKRLQNMLFITEHQKILLEKQRQEFSMELELQKFVETKDTDQ